MHMSCMGKRRLPNKNLGSLQTEQNGSVRSNSLGLNGSLGTHVEKGEVERGLVFTYSLCSFAASDSSRVGRHEWMTGKEAMAGAIYSFLLAVECPCKSRRPYVSPLWGTSMGFLANLW